MDVKQAITRARDYLGMVFSDEAVAEVRLEEVVFDRDERSWLITFGLLRPPAKAANGTIVDLISPSTPTRSYKVVKLPDDGNDPPSIRIRDRVGE